MPQPQIGMNQNNNDLVDALLAALSKPVPQTPAGDIRPITVSAQRPAPMPVEQPMAQPQAPAIPSSAPRSAPQLDENGQTGIGRFLSRLGIPLATAAVGMAAPQTLPGAAGFQTGYSGELIKDRELERKNKLKEGLEPIYDYNKDTGALEIKGYMKHGGKLVTSTTPKSEDDEVRKQALAEAKAIVGQDPMQFLGSDDPSGAFDKLLNDRISTINASKQTGTGVKQAQTKTKEVQSNNMVTLRAKDGTTMQMSKEEAMQKGYIK